MLGYSWNLYSMGDPLAGNLSTEEPQRPEKYFAGFELMVAGGLVMSNSIPGALNPPLAPLPACPGECHDPEVSLSVKFQSDARSEPPTCCMIRLSLCHLPPGKDRLENYNPATQGALVGNLHCPPRTMPLPRQTPANSATATAPVDGSHSAALCSTALPAPLPSLTKALHL